MSDNKSPRLALLSLSTETLEDALYLPDGYKIVAMHYDVDRRDLKLTLLSDAFPEVQECCDLPRATLLVTVHQTPDIPGYRKITTEIKI
jgi:hypothetical protein